MLKTNDKWNIFVLIFSLFVCFILVSWKRTITHLFPVLNGKFVFAGNKELLELQQTSDIFSSGILN